jgi:hypothetical protein
LITSVGIKDLLACRNTRFVALEKLAHQFNPLRARVQKSDVLLVTKASRRLPADVPLFVGPVLFVHAATNAKHKQMSPQIIFMLFSFD